jgi:predicted nucleic acid-binding protein
MSTGPVILDSDTLSLLSRGDAQVLPRARAYLEAHGRLTITSVTVFERLRGYRAALGAGKPFEPQLRSFEALVANCIVLPFDRASADQAARIWAALSAKARRGLGDILIAAIASVRRRPLVTRNRRDFLPMAALDFTELRLLDWSKRS